MNIKLISFLQKILSLLMLQNVDINSSSTNTPFLSWVTVVIKIKDAVGSANSKDDSDLNNLEGGNKNVGLLSGRCKIKNHPMFSGNYSYYQFVSERYLSKHNICMIFKIFRENIVKLLNNWVVKSESVIGFCVLIFIFGINTESSGYDSISVAGDWNGWDASSNLLSQSPDNPSIWNGVFHLNHSSTNVQFKFVANESWDVIWGAENVGNMLNIPVTNHAVLSGNNFEIVGPLNAKVHFQFNIDTLEYEINKIEYVNLTANWNNWSRTRKPLVQSLSDNSLWQGLYSVNTESDYAEFKFVINKSWDTVLGSVFENDPVSYDETHTTEFTGHNILIEGPVNTVLYFEFNEDTFEYLVKNIVFSSTTEIT